MDRQRLTIILTLISVLLALSAWIIYSGIVRYQTTFPAGSPPLDLTNTILPQSIDLTKMRPPAIRNTDFARFGGATSSASIILFGDYSCQECKLLEKSIYTTLPKYRGLVRYVWRDLPKADNRDDINAAVFTECAGLQGKFWQVHDLLMAVSVHDEFTLSSITTQLKLDDKALSSCRLDPMTEATIMQDAQEASGVGVTSTPILFIGTQATKDVLTPTELDKRIKQFLSS